MQYTVCYCFPANRYKIYFLLFTSCITISDLYFFLGKLILILDIADRIIYRVCPFVAAGVVIGSIYWTAVTYGALTIMQAVGAKEGLALMEQSDPLFLLIGLPTVPVMLILGRLVRWEEALLSFLNKNIPRVPIVKHLLPTFQVPSGTVRPHNTEIPPFSDPVSATRVLCGALIFPTMAVLMGKLLFQPVRSNLQKTLFVSIFSQNQVLTSLV